MIKQYYFLLFLFAAFSAVAQNCPNVAFGSKTLYPIPSKKLTSAPQGYTAVFINHVGRHGARHLTKDVATSYAYALIQQADSAKALTAKGQFLQEMVKKLEKLEKKNFESISAQGQAEQQGLAKRMVKNFPAVFAGSPSVKVTVAKKVRTSQSADAFLSGLKATIATEAISKTINDTILRFYDLAPAYASFEKSGSWKSAFTSFKETHKYGNLAQQVAKPFFSASFLKTLSAENLEEFVDDIYGFGTITASIQQEIGVAGYQSKEINFLQFFSCDQLQTLNSVGDVEDFLVKGPGTNALGIQVKIAAPLLMNFLKTTDEFMTAKTPGAELRFSHAETVAPFAALLGIHGAASSEKSMTAVSTKWQAASIIPLSANIQWVVYQGANKSNYLIKFLLNEKEVGIDGLNTKSYPYYNWNDVRKFYFEKLRALHTSTDDNGYQYLLTVK